MADDPNALVGPSTMNVHLMALDETNRWAPLKMREGGLASTATIGPNSITNGMLRQGGAHTVIGNSTNATANVADISVTDGKFLGSRAQVLGAFYPAQILSKSSSYPLVTDDYGATVLVTAAATVTLPAPATVGSGWWVCIKKTVAAGSDVTVARNASETIDGRSASDVLKDQYATASYVTDGTNWYVFGVQDYIEVVNSSSQSFPTSPQTGDAGFLDVPPGEWDCSGLFEASFGSTSTFTNFTAGIMGTTTGNSLAGLTVGQNRSGALPPTSATNMGVSIPSFRSIVTTTTRYYAKVQSAYTGTAPTYTFRMSLRRVR